MPPAILFDSVAGWSFGFRCKCAWNTLAKWHWLLHISYSKVSSGTSWRAHMVKSDASDISHSNRRLSVGRRLFLYRLSFLLMLLFARIMCWLLICYLPFFVHSLSLYSNDNVLISLFHLARLSSFFHALKFVCLLCVDVIRYLMATATALLNILRTLFLS